MTCIGGAPSFMVAGTGFHHFDTLIEPFFISGSIDPSKYTEVLESNGNWCQPPQNARMYPH